MPSDGVAAPPRARARRRKRGAGENLRPGAFGVWPGPLSSDRTKKKGSAVKSRIRMAWAHLGRKSAATASRTEAHTRVHMSTVVARMG